MPQTPLAAAQGALRSLRTATAKLDNLAVSTEPDDLDLDATARLLRTAEEALGELRDAVHALRLRIFDLLPDWYEHTTEAGTIKRSMTGKRTAWDGPRLASVVAARCADQAFNRSTGELLPVAAICQMVADELDATHGFTPSKPWRRTALQARGIEPDRYSETTEGQRTVRWLD